MSIHRVALIFDDRIRPDTTGVYCPPGAGRAGRCRPFPARSAPTQIPATGFDLYLSIDDDTDHRLPGASAARGLTGRSTRTCDFAARVRAVRRPCDLVFAAQRDGAERLRAAGIESASWLPLACDPAVHRKHDVPKQYDIASSAGLALGHETTC